MNKKNVELRQVMKRYGLTCWQLADILEVSESTVYRWFRHELPEDKKSEILEKIRMEKEA